MLALNTGNSIKHGNKKTIHTPSIGNGTVQRVKVENSTRHKWVKGGSVLLAHPNRRPKAKDELFFHLIVSVVQLLKQLL